MKLFAQGVEVNSLMLNAVSDVPWMNIWLKGQAELNAQNYTNAVATFKTLDTASYLKDNSTVMVNMAYCYNFMYDDQKAITYLQRVREGLINCLLDN